MSDDCAHIVFCEHHAISLFQVMESSGSGAPSLFFFFRWFWEHDLQYLIDIQLELKNNLGKVFLWWNYFVFVTIAFMGGQWFNFSLGSSNWYFQFISLLNQDNKCYFLTVKKMTSYFMNAVDRSEILRRAHFMSWFVTGFPGTLKMIFKKDNFILIIKS